MHKGIKILLVLLALGFGSRARADFCAYDSGYSDPSRCFTTYAEAEQYLLSNAKAGKTRDDINSGLFELKYNEPYLGGIRYGYGYRDVTPTIDEGDWYRMVPEAAACGPSPIGSWAGQGCTTDVGIWDRMTTYWSQNLDPPPLAPWQTVQYQTYTEYSGVDSVLRPWPDPGQHGIVSKDIYYERREAFDSRFSPNPWGEVTHTHFWRCPDTHGQRNAPSFGQTCQGFDRNVISVRGFIDDTSNLIRLAKTCKIGNPCHPQTGVKTQREPDFTWENLHFARIYHSTNQAGASPQFGPQWLSVFDTELLGAPDSAEFIVRVADEIDVYKAGSPTGTFYSTNRPGSVLAATSSSVVLKLADGRVLTYDKYVDNYRLAQLFVNQTNRSYTFDYCHAPYDTTCSRDGLRSVISDSGRRLIFNYADQLDGVGAFIANRVVSITADGATQVSYTYDPQGRLASAVYPGVAGPTSRTYSYNQSGRYCVNAAGNPLAPCLLGGSGLPLLTSIRDENGVEFAIFKYDNSGRVVSSEHVGGVDKVTLTYSSPSVTNVTDQSGASLTYTSALSRFTRLSSLAVAGKSMTYTYDANGYPDLATDRATVVRDFDYDFNGRLTKVTSAKGKPEQQVETFAWDASANRISLVTAAGQTRAMTYNSRAQLVTKTITDTTSTPNRTRSMVWTYCEAADVTAGLCPRIGLLRSVDGPRTDVSDVVIYNYYMSDDPGCATGSCRYRMGDLKQVVDATGAITETLAYDANGRPTSVADANGVVTDFEYSPRGWLLSAKTRGTDPNSEADDPTTAFEYDSLGQMAKIKFADQSYLTMSYDSAHRLKTVSDALNNTITITTDAAGGRTKEDTRDAGGVLRRTLS